MSTIWNPDDFRMGAYCDLPALPAPLRHSTHGRIIFEVHEDEVDGGFVATAPGRSIATQGDTLDDLRERVRDAVRCHFDDGAPGPPAPNYGEARSAESRKDFIHKMKIHSRN